MAEIRQFQPVEVPDESADAGIPARVAASMLSLGLKTLSQRAISATKDVFTLLSVGTIFWIWNDHPDPSVTQIVSLSLYATFILAANVIVRRV